MYVITLPATAVDKTNNLPIDITETLKQDFHLVRYLSFPWKKAVKWSREIAMSVPEFQVRVVTYHSR